jgi:predicted RNA-binding Zn ribbon-like protein
MNSSYPGPVGHEPLAIELHNTVYSDRGDLIDGLGSPNDLTAWLDAISDRLPAPALDVDAERLPEFLALRGGVREALHGALDAERLPAAVLEVLNTMAERAPASPLAVLRADGRLEAARHYHAADPTDIALATLAADAIELLGGPGRDDLRACGGPRCVLMFLKDHPRRTWCSATCGNRARQARHYARLKHARD